MDALTKLFSLLGSTELLQTVMSIAGAAIVFFYSVYLLRKEEMAEQEDAEHAAADIGVKLPRQA